MQRTRDAAFVVLLMMLPSALYVPRLGFTSDDWAFLGSLTTQGDLSAPGRSTQFDFADYLRPRPVQAAYQTLLYDVFGVNPLGYHVVNAFVLAAMGALCYLLLRELGLPRLPALAVAVTFGLLPHYSTDRFWWAAFGYAAAMALAFVSIWADLVALRSRGARRWVLKVTALVALALCGLGIEIALPLLVLAVPLLWYRARRLPTPDRLGRRGTALFLGSNVLVIAGIVAIKLAFPVGVGVGNSYPLHLARLALGSAATNFGSYGLGLPEAARWAVATVDAATLAVGVLLAVAVCAYLGMVGRWDPSGTWSVRRWLLLVVAGLVVYAASYGLFLTNGRILFTSTGINNRVAIAAAVGVALIWVGVAGAASAAVPARLRSWVFAVSIAAVCLSGFLILNGLAAMWSSAWQREQDILADIRTRLPVLEPGTTILLDGACPYIGPGIVFESNWDLAGALETRYGVPTVRADVVSRNLSMDEGGVTTLLYGYQEAHYDFGPRLLVFDARDSSVRPLADAAAARAWWATRTEPACPRGGAGYGVTLFSWDRTYRQLENVYLWR